ncbi:hypothetical protein PPACK8108_LOCUS24115 [Phakopsora pachyrhizi]|uniref:Uncharacterized protein n=1 Tax=Phakopsora pachyrhizi TaxID=170000 RepID=A0AAV0BQS6_PHAPC|nr:hypothetical protein PPACK8108_LOCUS24115 [Phakopsora pachyrhizi]
MFKCIFDVTPAKVSSDTGNLYLLEAPSSPNCSSLPSSSMTTIPLRSQQRPSSLLMTTSSIITEDNVLAEPHRSVSTIATTIPRQSVSTQVGFLNKQITHSTATISGLLRASPYIVITDHTYITCKSSGTNRYRALISYLDKKEPLNPFLLQPSTSSEETFKPAFMDSRTSLKPTTTESNLIKLKPINDSNNVQNQRLRVNARRPLKDNRRSGKLLTEEVDQEHCISLNED